MDLGGMLGNLLQQYTGGAAQSGSPHDHFDQVSQNVDQGSLASAIGGMIRSNETPAFSQIAGQIFGNGNADQKAAILNGLLAGVPALSNLIPGLGSGGSVTPQQAQNISPDVVAQAAATAEKHDPSIIDQMSSIYAAHPALVKTLGAGAMIVALREIAKNYAPQQ